MAPRFARGAVAPSGPDGPAPPSCSVPPEAGGIKVPAVGQTTITADLWPHPLTAAGRETVPAVVPPGATLADLVGDMLPGDIELDATIDGRAVPRAAWHETRLGEGQIVTLRAVVAGGDDDKNPFRILLQLAVIVATIFVPTLFPALGNLGQAAIGAAIAIGGGLIINAIAPLPLPDQSRPLQAEPLYSLTG
ncbi:MAG: MoaD/ThiS family protein, partial [Chloroflexi bacterium]|nr:MoaD/ThiS family protein [Chloroflexota bacterium]